MNFSNGWYVTPQFNAAAAAIPGSISSTWASRTGVDALARSVNTKTCADAGLTLHVDCEEVSGGLDIRSPSTSALGTPDPTYGQPGTPFGIGNGLDGKPDVFNINVINPTTQVSTQYQGRADFQVTKKDLIA